MSTTGRTVLAAPALVLPVGLAMALLSGASAGAATPHAAVAPRAPSATAAPTTTLHVSPTGDDAATGSASAPLRTPQRAVDRLGASGGTVVLHGGTYRGQRVVLANRTDVTVRAADGETPVLDLTGTTVPGGTTGVVEVRGGTRVAVEGLTVTGYRTRSTAATPIGIYATGATDGLRIVGNHVHHLGNDNPTLGSFDTNAHGIAVYGRSATAAMRDVTVSGNEVDHLVLGASEAVVLNGNVDGFAVTGNSVHDTNNIGIDAIGFEETIGGAARWTDVNRARHGRIAGNTVTRIRSEGNPAYFEDGQYCNCADGIYLDGALDVTIEQNTVREADIGIEVASEWARGRTNGVVVRGNTVTDSRYVGLALGGYDTARGEAYDIAVSGNTLRNNNTLHDGSPEVLLQYYVHDTRISGNTVTATDPAYPFVVGRVRPAGAAAKNRGLVLDANSYGGPVPASEAVFVWNGTERVGLAAWRRASGQDATSTWTVRP
ncbi:right-handed parallel beta-helix repeat-containing protein [Phycicoccus sonneratiae]|uniref:Right-handed parallel beta-helix repeat-containing protein n=1 Tax=Phycicoccus sonneratiae TaxID=2807628 RepID=A0ABS2CQX7_9MICO|nr:right-handed parallel beta-helix repeat-containing protein [Phycicoccus sonneraticus]MBM6402282.1 right-handed parallel beta-helix repeat-containing protein [Phycicoccus sonneraticus]